MAAASNATLYAGVEHEGVRAHCIYKPVAGERPLWDYPHATLSRREVAAYEVSAETGWDVVPPTVWRDGPFGEGSVRRGSTRSTPASTSPTWSTSSTPGGCRRAGWACSTRRTAPGATSRWCTPTTRDWPGWRCSTRSSTTPTARAGTCCPPATAPCTGATTA
ncbi:hypothetical protein GCM10025868_00620 [Angustibacter aerolatus]|uniref:Uncharacterized protein n=1 Tax=Angustibacter aerolatus TaxID=1162965 RepID=A0ABQ6JD42_9ACTN|nr:hypothetical protein [Angustibacter aerolatus]GMA84812.1 hypothetical protein GCM10025868_00620 [Angustibacter aerolatus]